MWQVLYFAYIIAFNPHNNPRMKKSYCPHFIDYKTVIYQVTCPRSCSWYLGLQHKCRCLFLTLSPYEMELEYGRLWGKLSIRGLPAGSRAGIREYNCKCCINNYYQVADSARGQALKMRCMFRVWSLINICLCTVVVSYLFLTPDLWDMIPDVSPNVPF